VRKVLPKIVITSGEPAGIGPDLCIMLAHKSLSAELIVIADADMLITRAMQLGISLKITNYSKGISSQHIGNGELTVLNLKTNSSTFAGKLDEHNSSYVLDLLTAATLGCVNHEFDAMVTAPVHKGIINNAGISFSGHTEFLAKLTNTPQVVMMLVGSGLRVALATTHLAIKDVPTAITKVGLETTIRILHQDLVNKFGLNNPHILVAGLNPHAGEDGYLGREEIDIINPVIHKLRCEGMNLTGALPADTLFAKHHLRDADAVLAMYHDQGLPVLKHISFGEGVNVTLGLPIIRTSVDHGTALNLAGTGNIEIGSMLAAIELAITLAKTKLKLNK